MESFSWTNARGQALHCQVCMPAAAQPAAALVFHHGYAEHISRKAAVFTALAAEGIAVFGYDAHGCGASEPHQEEERAYIHDYHHMVDDLLGFTHHVQQQYARQLLGCPLFVGGYSIGGQYATHAALQEPCLFAGLVLVSPAAGVRKDAKGRVLNLVAAPLNALVPHARIVSGLNPQHLLTDPQEAKAYEEDELVDHGGIRVRTALEIMRGAADLQVKAGQLRVPVFIIHSKDDHVTPLQDVRALVSKVVDGQDFMSDVTLKEVAGACHDLLAGPAGLQHAHAIAQWVESHA